MCFDFDSRPPDLPAQRIGPPIAGGAGAEVMTLSSADGTELSAAYAEAPGSSAPAVVILPDVRGLYPFYIELAERFAEAGHSAIAIDYYGRTAGPGPRDDAFDFAPHREQIELELATEDIRAGLEELRRRAGAGSIATVGFCFGGSLSFVSGANPDLGLSGVVGLYGILDASRFDGRGPLAQAGDIKVPLLGLFGGADQAIPAEDVESFEATLRDSGTEHEIHTYPGAPHSFFDKKQDEFAAESEDAWRRMLGFLSGIRERVA